MPRHRLSAIMMTFTLTLVSCNSRDATSLSQEPPRAVASPSTTDNPKQPTEADLAMRNTAVEAMRAYYGETPIGGGWTTGEPVPCDEGVCVPLYIPSDQLERIVNAGHQHLAFAAGCPSKYEPLWKVLPTTEDVIFEVHAQGDTRVVAREGCRAHL